ncbi:MAG: hypothetical protein KC620_04665 [Myxococcales bacterium]|nr:hypothetical protein [Myxococcales bacterium]
MQTLDVPQANDLDTVRAVVHAAWRGAGNLDAIADFTGFSRRHTHYRAHAARILGLLRVEEDEVFLTPLGERLVGTDPHTDKERMVLGQAVEQSPVMQVLAPDLLGREPPSIDDLAERLFQECKLSTTTARRRANGLLAWRRRVLGHALKGWPEPAPAEPAKPKTKGEQLSLF